MYQVSDAFMVALRRPDWKTKLNIEVIVGAQSYYLTEENILANSFEITNKCSGSENVEIGKVDIGELTATLIRAGLPRYALKGAKIIPTFYLSTADGYEPIPTGEFFIAEADWTTWGIEITAYDNMSKFDKAIALTSATGYIYDFVVYACTECGVGLGMTEEEMRALPNGSMIHTLYPENDIETWRDLLSWCALHTATFATIDREGKLVFRGYSQASVDHVNDRQRVNGAKFSDFQTRYTAVTLENVKKEEVEYYALEVDDGLTYHLGADPFLQNDATREAMARNILDALAMVDYVPFEASMATASIAYDLGDVLTFTDGIADSTKIYCITQYDWTYNDGYYAKGVGQNPALANARGKTDKAVSALSKKGGNGSSDFEIITNLREVSIEEGKRRRALRASIMTAGDAKVKMDAELLLAVTQVESGNVITCSVTYQLDGQAMDRNPVEAWTIGGRHILTLMYALAISQSGFHTFDIFLELDNGSVEIAPYDIQVTFSGMGIVVDPGWSGQIEIDEDAPMFAIPEVGFRGMQYTERVSAALTTPKGIALADVAAVIAIPEVVFDGSGYMENIGFGDYLCELTWEEAGQSTWGTLANLYIWGQTGGN